MRTRFAIGLAALSAAAFSTPAMADQITLGSSDIGSSFTLDYDGFVDSTTVDGLSGSATFSLDSISGNDYTFSYSVTNTSTAPVTGSRISSFAFNTDPTISGATSDGAFSYTTLTSNYPNGIGTVDVCFKDAATGSCAGGGSGGLLLGETGTGSFTLSFSQPVSELTLSDFFLRYQSITGVEGVSSASGAGTISSSSGGTDVPEPGMLGMFALGFAAILLGRKRLLPARRAARPAFA